MCGRLIEDHHRRCAAQRFGDLHQLSFPKRERLHKLIGIDWRFEKIAEQAKGVFDHSLPVDESKPFWQNPTAHVDVFRNRKIGEKAEFLVDRGDPDRAGVLRGQSGMSFAFDYDRADVRCNETTKNVLKRRFSRAVFAHQSDYFTSRYREACIPQYPRAGVVLANPLKSDQRLFVARHGSRPRRLGCLTGIGRKWLEMPNPSGP